MRCFGADGEILFTDASERLEFARTHRRFHLRLCAFTLLALFASFFGFVRALILDVPGYLVVVASAFLAILCGLLWMTLPDLGRAYTEHGQALQKYLDDMDGAA